MEQVNETGELLVFKAISTFIIELGRLYEKDYVQLGLYKRLILKTKISHTKPIKKHITSFKTWLEANSKAVEEQDESLMAKDNSVIKYSDNVYMDMNKVFSLADEDVKKVIWKHLHTINMLIHGSQGVVLDEKYEKEKDFIGEVMKKVESHVDPTDDPGKALNSMLNSGVFNDLLGSMNKGISEGSLDIGKLLNMTTSMLGNLQQNIKGADGMRNK